MDIHLTGRPRRSRCLDLFVRLQCLIDTNTSWCLGVLDADVTVARSGRATPRQADLVPEKAHSTNAVLPRPALRLRVSTVAAGVLDSELRG